MSKTVADQFVATLAAAGVKRIYGVVGDSLNGITEAIRRQGEIEWIHVRHEEAAAFASCVLKPILRDHSRSAQGAAVQATSISSMGCSIVTGRVFRFLQSPLTFHRRRSVLAISRRRSNLPFIGAASMEVHDGILGYYLSGVIALGIIIIGARFFVASHAAAAAFGVPVSPDASWDAYLSVRQSATLRPACLSRS